MKDFCKKHTVGMLSIGTIVGIVIGAFIARFIPCIAGIECKHVLDIIFLLIGLGAFFFVIWGHKKNWYRQTICCWLIAATVLLIISGVTYNIAKATLPFTELSFGNVFCIKFQEELESHLSACIECPPDGNCMSCNPFLSYFPASYHAKIKHILNNSPDLEELREDTACTKNLCEAVNVVKRFRKSKMISISPLVLEDRNKQTIENEEKINLLTLLIIDSAVLKTLNELSKQDCKPCR